MNKPLDIKALDVFLSAVEDRLNHLEQKMGMYTDEDRQPVSEDTLEKKRVCPECGMPEDECKCGHFDVEAKAAMTLGSDLKEGATINLDGKRVTLLRFGYTQFGTDGSPMWEVEADINGKPGTVEIHSERSYEVLKGSGAEHVHAKTYIVDAETKVRYVRDSAYWGVPVMTPITPGMKPQGPTSPAGRARRSSMTGRGIRRSMPRTSSGGDKTPGRAAPRKRVKPKNGPATQERRESAANVAAAARSASSGGKKPPSKPTPSASGGDNNGVSTTHFGTGGKGPGGSTHRAEISQNDDGTWGASFTRLNPKSGGESGGRTTVKDKFKSREEAEAWVNNSAKRSKVSANPDGDKEAAKERGEISDRVGELMSDDKPIPAMGSGKKPRPMTREEREAFSRNYRERRKNKDSFENPDGTPIPKDESGKNKFEKVVDEKTGAESYKPAKAEDFSVDSVAKELSNINPEGSPDGSGSVEKPIDVGDDVELAHELLAKGLHVRMKSKEGVSTLIKKVKEIADDAKAKGIEAPNYDFCKVSVPKTNLFCIESKGIPRTKMPQFKGEPHEGSFAETKFNEGKGEADVEPEFRELLEKMGIKTEMKTVKASELKATQDNLVGTKVAGMAGAMREGKIPDAPIFVTRDGYIVDGHHRWAAKIAMDLEDGVMGDVEMPVEVIDGDIGFILDVANGFADLAGIKRKGVGDDADGVKPTTGRSGDSVVLDGIGTVVQSDNTQGKKWWDIRDNFSKKTDDDCGCSGNVY